MGGKERVMDFGFSSQTWLLKQLVIASDPRLLKIAVLQIISALVDPDTESLPSDVVLDMLAQYIATGTYLSSEEAEKRAEDALAKANELLQEYGGTPTMDSDRMEEEMEKFRDFLSTLPEGSPDLTSNNEPEENK